MYVAELPEQVCRWCVSVPAWLAWTGALGGMGGMGVSGWRVCPLGTLHRKARSKRTLKAPLTAHRKVLPECYFPAVQGGTKA